jgi:hypothetical protein
MKKIAIFILFVFTLVQVVPTMQSLFKLNTGLVFNIDEEKGGEKADNNEKKEKKDYSSLSFVLEVVSAKTNACFHLAEKILPSPCLENLTPPPNFC